MSVKKELKVGAWIVGVGRTVLVNLLRDLELIIRWVVIGATAMAFVIGTGTAFRAVSLPWPDAAMRVLDIFNGFILVYGGIAYSMLLVLFWVSLIDWMMERTKDNFIRLVRQLLFVILLIGVPMTLWASITYGMSVVGCVGSYLDSQCLATQPGSLTTFTGN
ncbi:MAG: hypothetical protein AAB701_01775 [Patescibacteria group bacterium]